MCLSPGHALIQICACMRVEDGDGGKGTLNLIISYTYV